MTWGEAGVGKTTFCSKLVQDWAEIVQGRENPKSTKLTEEQHQLLSNIGLVLYVVLRDTSENQTLDDIVQSQIFNAVGENYVNVSERKYHKDVLLVCDGLDKVSYEKCEILEIISGRMYPNIRCIVTCRPHASLGMSLTADAEIRLKGFCEKQARHYVDVYFRQKYPDKKSLAEQKSSTLWHEIESSPDLQEMAINPSMLKLVCNMFSATGKIAKDKTALFTDYTYYLLQQYHFKLHKKRVSQRELQKVYKNILLKAGHLALQILSQSHMKCTNTFDIELAEQEMCDIGFVTEIPITGLETHRAQFIHKAQQEYLAAYYIVNSPNDEGMKSLMEFVSTSRGLIGSQIILTFTTAMSTTMDKIVKKQIQEFVSSMESEDFVSPKARTLFLLTMLQENRSLVFPLPSEICVNMQEFEENVGWSQWLSQLFAKRDALEKFFDFDNRGVQKLSIVLGQKHRLEILNKFRKSSICELFINFQRNVSAEDVRLLEGLVRFNKKLRILAMEQLNIQGTLNLFNNREFMSSLEKLTMMQIIKIHNSELKVDAEFASALNHIPSHIELDMSCNQFTDYSGCKSFIEKTEHLKSLIMQDCRIIIDTELAEAISQLPEQANLDLSGNTVTKMDSSLLCHVIPVISNKKIDLSGLGVVIDDNITQALCSLDKNVETDLSGNQVTEKSACILLIEKAAKMKSLSLCNCGVQIDTEIAEAVSRLPDHTQLDLSGNQVTDKSACITLIHKAATMKSLSICNCGIQIDTEIAVIVSRLPDHTKLNLTGNKVTDKSVCNTLLHKAATMKSVSICNCVSSCGIEIDTEIAEAISKLPEHTELDLSGNKVTDISVCITLIQKAGKMKTLSMCDCGLQIDTEIAEAISQLPEQANLDLSGNTVTKMDSSLLCHVIPVISNKKIDLSGLGMVIDDNITQTLSSLKKEVEVDLSGNKVSHKSVCITLIQMTVKIKSLCLCNCEITIDTEIAEAISQLPEQANLNLSGNTVTKMDSSLLCHVIPVVSKRKIDLSGLGITINADIAEAVSKLSDHTKLDLSANQVTDKSASITLIHKAATMKSLSICNCGIQIDTEIAEAVSMLPDHTQLDLSGNQVTDKSACITLIHKAATMKSLSICNCISSCGIEIDTVIAEALSRLPDHTELDLSGNQVTDKSVCITLINKAVTMKSLSICNCGIQIDKEIAEAVSRLPDDIQLDLSGNQVTDKSAYIMLIHKSATMKSLNRYSCLSNCGIQIDTEIAEAVSRLPDHTQLDMSGNQVTDKSACITLIHKAATMESLSICNCDIQIDSEIAEAVCKLPDQTKLDLSGNYITKLNPDLLPIILESMTKQGQINIDEWMITVDINIVRAMAKLSKLQMLICNYCYSENNNTLTNRAASALPKAVSSMPQLQALHLDNCGISNDVMVALTDSLYKNCPLLELLSLRYNHLSSGLWEVMTHIQQMKNLKTVWLDGNPCVKEDSQREKLETKLNKVKAEVFC